MMFSFVFILSISLDNFLLSFIYSFQKIRIPFRVIFLINFICTFSILVGIISKRCVGIYINDYILNLICFFVLLFLGLFKIFNFFIKRFINKLSENRFNFFIKIYSDVVMADSDKSCNISLKEAIPLSLSLSLDNFPFGFTLDFSFTKYLFFIFIIYFVIFYLGILLGKMIPNFKKDISLGISSISNSFSLINEFIVFLFDTKI